MDNENRELNPPLFVNRENLKKTLTTIDTKDFPKLVALLGGQIAEVADDPSVVVLDFNGIPGVENRHRFRRTGVVGDSDEKNMVIIEVCDGWRATIDTIPSRLMITLLEETHLTRSIFTFGAMTQVLGTSSNDHNIGSLSEQTATALRNGEIWELDISEPTWFEISFLKRVSKILTGGRIRDDLNAKAAEYYQKQGAKKV